MTEVITKARPAEGGLTMTMQTSVRTVLVVDDHADTRTLLRYVLESHHYQVAEATDGREAVNLAETILPDLILMDTTLKSMDGLEAMNCIRSMGRTQSIPIVFLSGHAQPQARALALECGANEYLVKPVSIEALEKAVEQQLFAASQKVKSAAPQHCVDSRENYL